MVEDGEEERGLVLAVLDSGEIVMVSAEHARRRGGMAPFGEALLRAILRAEAAIFGGSGVLRSE